MVESTSPNIRKVHMKRTLLIITNKKTGEISVCFGTKKYMKEIGNDQKDTDTSALYLTVEGPKTNMQAIEVAWDVENEVLTKHWESAGGLQTMLKQMVEFVVAHHDKFKATS